VPQQQGPQQQGPQQQGPQQGRRQEPTPPRSGRARRKDALGRWGEDLAARHLAAAGLVVLDRNWRCRDGELDVVAREPDGTVVFVEVKTRSTSAFGLPSEAVGRTKARRIRRLASAWLAQQPSADPSEGAPVRFDVVSIVRSPGEAPMVQHLLGAF
jgi:putative endonuclease